MKYMGVGVGVDAGVRKTEHQATHKDREAVTIQLFLISYYLLDYTLSKLRFGLSPPPREGHKGIRVFTRPSGRHSTHIIVTL